MNNEQWEEGEVHVGRLLTPDSSSRLLTLLSLTGTSSWPTIASSNLSSRSSAARPPSEPSAAHTTAAPASAPASAPPSAPSAAHTTVAPAVLSSAAGEPAMLRRRRSIGSMDALGVCWGCFLGRSFKGAHNLWESKSPWTTKPNQKHSNQIPKTTPSLFVEAVFWVDPLKGLITYGNPNRPEPQNQIKNTQTKSPKQHLHFTHNKPQVATASSTLAFSFHRRLEKGCDVQRVCDLTGGPWSYTSWFAHGKLKGSL